ncbi:SecDF P1 head subdomain-containing protein [Rhabdothermincola salaria]|uniref:SecDF P1 head subdomain-containing protein n=1 Tax=Rhabdothermincola salaria TaxID=2903142 RepID=UPI001E4F1C65|nr:hypothetical protein [Rhabdothermincola salaria]MCD9624190.1 hypothetical protein [Rhabdothermincola salaria]
MRGSRSIVVALVVMAGVSAACSSGPDEPSSAPVSAAASNTPTTEAVFPTATAPPESVSFRPVVTGPASSGSQDDLPTLDQLGPVVVDGRGIVRATAAPGQGDEWEVQPELAAGEAGIDAFNAIATACTTSSDGCPTGQVALVVDGEVVTAPTIMTPSFEADEITITGGWDQAQAEDIARTISAGAHG